MEMNGINQIAKVIDHFRRNVNKDLPSQHIAIFMAVAENEGITMPELIRLLDMPQGTLSRNVKLLSRFMAQESGRTVLKGHDLLRTEPVPTGRHALAVYLTDNGKFLLREIEDIMNQATPLVRSDAGDASQVAHG